MNIPKISLVLFIFFFSASHSAAQTTSNSEKVDEKTADVAITAKVEAKELKFEVVPNAKVEFPGNHERKTEWSSERKNLPDSVQPNVTYRDIGIKLKIVSVFADIDKIVDEALGIKPPSQTAVAGKDAQPVETKPKENSAKPTRTRKNRTTGKSKN